MLLRLKLVKRICYKYILTLRKHRNNLTNYHFKQKTNSQAIQLSIKQPVFNLFASVFNTYIENHYNPATDSILQLLYIFIRCRNEILALKKSSSDTKEMECKTC